jgi:3-oxoacyl-[acyl-carrier protein] reductase
VVVNAQFGADCKSVIDEIRAVGGRAIAVEGPIETSEGCDAMWRESTGQLGHIDILVNSGGTSRLTAAAGPDVEDDIWEANVFGPLRLARLAAEAGMRSPGGTIVNVAAVPAMAGHPLLTAYRTSQAALISATRTLASALAPAGIRVNVIATEVGDANVAQVMAGPLLAETDARITPDGPAVEDEVAVTALYLASDASAPATGSVFSAQGRVS